MRYRVDIPWSRGAAAAATRIFRGDPLDPSAAVDLRPLGSPQNLHVAPRGGAAIRPAVSSSSRPVGSRRSSSARFPSESPRRAPRRRRDKTVRGVLTFGDRAAPRRFGKARAVTELRLEPRRAPEAPRRAVRRGPVVLVAVAEEEDGRCRLCGLLDSAPNPSAPSDDPHLRPRRRRDITDSPVTSSIRRRTRPRPRTIHICGRGVAATSRTLRWPPTPRTR